LSVGWFVVRCRRSLFVSQKGGRDDAVSESPHAVVVVWPLSLGPKNVQPHSQLLPAPPTSSALLRAPSCSCSCSCSLLHALPSPELHLTNPRRAPYCLP
jgi:hypothetical protein